MAPPLAVSSRSYRAQRRLRIAPTAAPKIAAAAASAAAELLRCAAGARRLLVDTLLVRDRVLAEELRPDPPEALGAGAGRVAR